MIAQFCGETRHARQGQQRAPHLVAQPRHHFPLHVIPEQRRAGQQPLAQGLFVGIQQHQADAGWPALQDALQLLETLWGKGQTMDLEHLFKLIGRECQRFGLKFEQVPLQEQPGQLPRRLTPTGDPPADRGRPHVQQKIEAIIEFGTGVPRVVVEHDPDGLADTTQQSQQVVFRTAA